MEYYPIYKYEDLSGLVAGIFMIITAFFNDMENKLRLKKICLPTFSWAFLCYLVLQK